MTKAYNRQKFSMLDAPVSSRSHGGPLLTPRGLGIATPSPQVVSAPVDVVAPKTLGKTLWRGLPILVLIGLSVIGYGQILYVSLADVSPQKPHTIDIVAITGLWFCCLCYLINRYGSSKRDPIKQIDSFRMNLTRTAAPSSHISVLIPSYCEEPRVIEMTVLSAALALYPSRDIAVLIDDPVRDTISVARSLAAVQKVKSDLNIPVERMRDEHRAWLRRRQSDAIDQLTERNRLAQNYIWLANWLDEFGQSVVKYGHPAFAHIDRFFQDAVVNPLARYFQNLTYNLETITTVEQIDAIYANLSTVFCTDIKTFQRKEFANLSHAANKAMNLNAYISLMGGSYRRRSQLKRVYLREETTHRPNLVVRKPDFVLTLDADSLIRPQYLHELAAVLEKDPTLAVVQTPYLSFPGSKTAVERFAGATTDIQYLIHQGSTFFKASFWIGANALLRFSALKDIETTEQQDGKTVAVFIQDRTVIEDTGSTIDLLAKGWRVENYFAPLAHSATPADFGALCIQRKRWCNGGLLIIGSLIKAMFTAPRGSFGRLSFVLRAYYLLSPVIGNLCLFTVMINARPNLPVIFWMAVTVSPYYLLYGIDLKRLGYRFIDVFPVSALNLLLLPVALAGIAESLVQLLTGRKTNFVRTPKVEGRTGVPAIYILFYIALISYTCYGVVQGINNEDYFALLNPIVNLTIISYGVLIFIGGWNALKDVGLGLKNFVRSIIL